MPEAAAEFQKFIDNRVVVVNSIPGLLHTYSAGSAKAWGITGICQIDALHAPTPGPIKQAYTVKLKSHSWRTR